MKRRLDACRSYLRKNNVEAHVEPVWLIELASIDLTCRYEEHISEHYNVICHIDVKNGSVYMRCVGVYISVFRMFKRSIEVIFSHFFMSRDQFF